MLVVLHFHNLGFSILEIACLFYKILASPSSGLMITIPIMEPNSMSHPYGKWTLAGGAAHIVTFIVIHLTILSTQGYVRSMAI